jgi:hypothetical protein
MDPRVASFEIAASTAGRNRFRYARTIGFVTASILPLVFVCISLRSLAAITLRNGSHSHTFCEKLTD